MKKILTALLCLTMCAMAAGCSNDDSSSKENSSVDSEITESVIPDGSSEDPSSADDSEGDPSSEDDSSEPDEPDVDRTSATSVANAYLAALSDGDTETQLLYCPDPILWGESSKYFKYSVSDTIDEYTADTGKNISVVHCTYTEDGSIKSDELFVVLSKGDDGFRVESAVFSEYPVDVLMFLGVAKEDIDVDFEDNEAEQKETARAVLTMAEDVMLDAQINGASIKDGQYKMGDGSVMSRAIDANLEYQKIDIVDYMITVSEGKVVSAAVSFKDGTGIGVIAD